MMTTRLHRLTRFGLLLATLAICLSFSPKVNAQGRRVREVNARLNRQQDRIGAGLHNGNLTPAEAARLEARENFIVSEEHAFREQHNGHLTARETISLNRQENRVSRDIFSQRHDDQAVGTPRSEVGWRENAQQQRIAQGVSNGQLTAAEAARLETREAALRQQIAADRAANGGTLTDAQRREINRELNTLSAQIYRQRHDAQTTGH